MSNFVKELKRREVFKTGGLYIGIAWVLIEASSVILPTFGVPDWVFKGVVIIAFIGFPVALVLAWFYDVTEEGVLREDETEGPAGTIVSSRLTNFVIIGILAVALSMSLYFNFAGRPGEVIELEPVSVLIADFDNQTGDPLFDNSLEQALNIGLEGATFITAFNRQSAHRLLESLKPGSTLDEAGARLVSIREGIKLVVAGSVKPDGGGYVLSAKMVNPEDGEAIAESSVEAKGKLEVLTAVSALADSIREELGDKSVDDERPLGETFTAASLEAVKYYTQAQDLAAAARHEEAQAFYEKAIAEDPNFGRAYSGLALTLFNLGKNEEAGNQWETSISKLNTMTDRERYRTLGLYYIAITQDYQKAIESYQALVDKYPADNTGLNNLSIAYYYTLDFDKALETVTKALEIYPSNKTVRTNYTLFAMLAGDFAESGKAAEQLIKEDPDLWKPRLPLAISKIVVEDYAGALEAYQDMAAISTNGKAFANIGTADVYLFNGKFSEAEEFLVNSLNTSPEDANKRLLATQNMLLAKARQELGNKEGAQQAIKDGLALHEGTGQLVQAALTSIDIGDFATADSLAEKLNSQLQPRLRSFGMVIRGAIASREGRHADAIDALRNAITLQDSWLLRFHLGRAYFEAGKFVEALDEFEICRQRRGEASAMFLDDDDPTWRFMAELPYWTGRAQEKMGMADVARENFIAYVATRPDGGPLVDDARERVGK